MSGLGTFVLVVGYILAGVGWIWLLVVAFQESVGWGLATLLIGIVGVVFAFTHWEDAKKPFLTWVASIPVIILGLILAASGGH